MVACRSAGAIDIGSLSVGGDVTYTSAYIFRGITQSDGNGAAQLDLHAAGNGGTFAGVFASSLSRILGHGARFELDEYLGHRFDLSPSWSTTVTAVNYSYLDSNLPFSADYQELAAAVSYLDRWTVSVSASPNAVRYVQRYRLGRYAAYAADASGQFPIFGPVLATAGVGYYSLTGPEGTGYAYGNVGLAFQYKDLRVDAGYYAVAEKAQYLFPYGRARDRFAGTVSWHF